ncbi:DUF115 domain-containing protein [Bacteroides oleiciplenus]|uniref:DUF115 domain-containing protein n=1 Tax=Bacteroides oleiciplenus TaxID=626931 RepID=A0A3E5BCI5_9BACE|nr:DUF115 domain-containing protein [Bacteroides oleiciplenus]
MSNYLFNFYKKYPFLTKIYKDTWLGGIIRFFVNIPPFLKFKSRMCVEYCSTINRRLGYSDQRFLPLKEYNNKYKGKRIFITCTGPSLTISDLELLKDEYVFGMNSICKIHDKTDWKPDFFGIQDLHVFEKLKKYIYTTDNGIIFVPSGYKIRYDIPDNWIIWPMSAAYHLFELHRTHKYFAKFSEDPYITVYDGYSITYSILQLVIYMGFDEIYLLGADCTYLGQKQHFIETGNYDPTFESATERLFASYGEAKKFAENRGVKIFNATRGGCLEMFPRVRLEDALANKVKNKLQ